MKDYRVYRCKRCGEEIIAKDMEVLRTKRLERIVLSAESVTLFAFENSWIHHCRNNSIGVCELIGWEAEE
nr:MAG TPA: MqsA [Caudoviricetes sp.]